RERRAVGARAAAQTFVDLDAVRARRGLTLSASGFELIGRAFRVHAIASFEAVAVADSVSTYVPPLGGGVQAAAHGRVTNALGAIGARAQGVLGRACLAVAIAVAVVVLGAFDAVLAA